MKPGADAKEDGMNRAGTQPRRAVIGPKRKAVALLLLMLLLNPLSAALAASNSAPRLELVSATPLQFSRPPIRIDGAVMLPNGNLAVLHFSLGATVFEESYWLDLFSATSERLLSRQLVSFRQDADSYPLAQILIKRDHFILEYYPDVTTMEVCFQSSYSFGGRALQADRKRSYAYGEALYAQNIGSFLYRWQSHAVDEPDADAHISVDIEHVPSGRTMRAKLWDFAARRFADDQQRLWIVQRNEQGLLEIRSLAAGEGMKEHITALNEPSLLADGAMLSAAVSHQGKARIVVYRHDAAPMLLTYDPTKQLVTARSALGTPEEARHLSALMSVGRHLLAVYERWDDNMQQNAKALALIDGNMAQHPLPFTGRAFSVLQDSRDDSIAALEQDDDEHWVMRVYRLDGMKSGAAPRAESMRPHI